MNSKKPLDFRSKTKKYTHFLGQPMYITFEFKFIFIFFKFSYLPQLSLLLFLRQFFLQLVSEFLCVVALRTACNIPRNVCLAAFLLQSPFYEVKPTSSSRNKQIGQCSSSHKVSRDWFTTLLGNNRTSNRIILRTLKTVAAALTIKTIICLRELLHYRKKLQDIFISGHVILGNDKCIFCQSKISSQVARLKTG